MSSKRRSSRKRKPTEVFVSETNVRSRIAGKRRELKKKKSCRHHHGNSKNEREIRDVAKKRVEPLIVKK